MALTGIGADGRADRVEGTLFGNGERTGNVDIVTLGLNMMTQGVDPHLDFQIFKSWLIQLNSATSCLCINATPMRASWCIRLSGSHQDAIRKGWRRLPAPIQIFGKSPYLPIDPADIGRTYEAIIRVNSQSGKAGSAWLLETEHHIRLPRGMEVEFSQLVQKEADHTGEEITSSRIWDIFKASYLDISRPFELVEFDSRPTARGAHTEGRGDYPP